MSLKYLTASNFEVLQGQKGRILCNNLQGISVVLFYSKDCVYCQNALPIFNKLPSSIRSVTFCALNVTNHPSIVNMSNETIDPIRVVPYIVLYVNSKPFVRYKGKFTYNDIGEFVFELSKRLQSKQRFTISNKDNDTEVIDNEVIPPYAICKEYNCSSDGVCYLNFNKLNNTIT